ncbi:hypothetical protein ACFOLD_05335 [Kocuria carniphila]
MRIIAGHGRRRRSVGCAAKVTERRRRRKNTESVEAVVDHERCVV